MQTVFVIFLVLNLLVEANAAVLLIMGPDGLSAAGTGGQWSMHYGFAALAIASASLWVWRWRTDRHVVTAILGMLLVFHAGLFISLAAAGDQQAGMIIHAVLTTLGLILFTQRSRWCVAPIDSLQPTKEPT